MKKFASVVAAGALLLSTAGVTFARVHYTPMPSNSTDQSNNGTLTVVGSVALSNSGLNRQTGGSKEIMTTGSSVAVSDILSVANQNGLGSGSGKVNQSNYKTVTLVLSGAVSNSGLNSQSGTSSRRSSSVQVMHTGNTETGSYVSSWANINLDGVALN